MHRIFKTLSAAMFIAFPANAQESILMNDELVNLNQPTIIINQMNHTLSNGILSVWGSSTNAGSILFIWDVDVTGFTDIRAEFTYRRGGSAQQWEQSDWIQMVTLNDANQIIQGSTTWRARPPSSWTIRSSGDAFTDTSLLEPNRIRIGFRARTTQSIEIIQIDSFRVFGTPLPCLADLSGDGQLDFFDVSSFLTFFQFDDPRADMNDDGNLDFFDVSLFLQAFIAGCP